MSSNKDSMTNIVKIAFLVCLVCSIVVSTAAVSLKPQQEINKVREVKKNILAAAGLLDDSRSIEEQFEVIRTQVVDLKTGQFAADIDAETYDQRKASKDPAASEKLTASDDIASIKRLENYSKVYTVEENGQLKTLILPIRGYGLWSTLRGFVALESDLNTVVGFGFYEHAETPGLGGEVDNPRWKSQWIGKKVYDNSGDVALFVKKGTVDQSIALEAAHGVDGLAGATLTAKGVSNLVEFWMGENGFAPFLNNLKAGGA